MKNIFLSKDLYENPIYICTFLLYFSCAVE